MSWAINNLTAPDAYTDASTLLNLRGVSRVTIIVANQSIYRQLKRATGTGLFTEGGWDQEVFMPPATLNLFRTGVVGVRFRAAIPAANLPASATQAQVTIEVD